MLVPLHANKTLIDQSYSIIWDIASTHPQADGRRTRMYTGIIVIRTKQNRNEMRKNGKSRRLKPKP